MAQESTSAKRHGLGKPPVWDNHACLPMRPGDRSFFPQLERLSKAGVDVVSINVGYGPYSIEHHFRMLAELRSWIGEHPEGYAIGSTVNAIQRARDEGKLAITFDIEGAAAVGDQLSLVRLYYDLGVRWMSLAYNTNNAIGGGCYEDDGGLTELGRALIGEMNQVGMVICCSHTGERSARQAVDLSRDPVIFSHSNPYAVYPHTRNIKDDLIRHCASRGGVIGINGIGPFLTDGLVTPEIVAHHVDHVAQLVGPEHVGISLDYVFDLSSLKSAFKKFKDTFPDTPDHLSLAQPEDLTAIADILTKRGYDGQAIDGIMGGNWLRIAETVWR